MNDLLFFNIGQSEIILISVVAIIPILLMVFCLIDIIRSDFKDGTVKILWIICVLVAPFLGSVIYLVIGRTQKVRPLKSV